VPAHRPSLLERLTCPPVSSFSTHAATGHVLSPLHLNPLAAILLVGVVTVGAAGCKPLADAQASAAPKDEELSATAGGGPHPDLSGRTRFGDASFYAKKFTGREMADGNKMDPHGDNAASKTLPLGTTARVTNIETGESAVVTIEDRGPHVDGRIVDLSPSTAQKIGITEHHGVAKVTVAPISIPLPDGGTKCGVATSSSAPCVSPR
jgi:rare lipoprotein A